jgi:hypothetical protein
MKMKILVAVTLLLCTCTAALAQEKKIQRSDLPAAVQKAADEQSKGATVRGYAKEIEHGQVSYEVQLQFTGHTKDVSISPDGKVLEIEEEVELTSLPAEVRDSLQTKAGKDKIVRVESLTKKGKLVAHEAQVNNAGKKSEIQVGTDGKPLAHAE